MATAYTPPLRTPGGAPVPGPQGGVPDVRVVAFPWTFSFSLSTGNRRFIPFLNVTRSVRAVADQDITLSFAAADAAVNTGTELTVGAGVVYQEQVQVTGFWVLNRSGSTAAVSISAVLTPYASEDWPTYSAAGGNDAVDEDPTIDAAVSIS